MTSDLTRSWNDTPITRRASDGYVNATAMCKANGKEWFNYFKSDRTSAYLEALSRNLQTEVTDLWFSKPGEGTWVHPRIAVDLARWISAPFAVWMDGWFLESVNQERQESTTPAPALACTPEQTMAVLKDSITLLQELGVFDDRDRLLFGDMIRNTAARSAGGMLLPANPDQEELTLSDAWLEVTGQPLPRGKGSAIGKLAAAMYREEYQEEPPTRIQYVDGAPRKVKSYRRGWLLKAVEAVSSRLAAR